jgi:hypothetical protein
VRGGRGWAIWRAVQAVHVGFGEMATPKHGKNRSICRGGLQVPLPTEREGFVCSASQRSTTMEDVLIHFLGNAVAGGPGTHAEIRGRRTSAMEAIRINKGCHVKCDGDVNFVGCGRVGVTSSGGGQEGCSVHLLCNVDPQDLQSRVQPGKESLKVDIVNSSPLGCSSVKGTRLVLHHVLRMNHKEQARLLSVTASLRSRTNQYSTIDESA